MEIGPRLPIELVQITEGPVQDHAQKDDSEEEIMEFENDGKEDELNEENSKDGQTDESDSNSIIFLLRSSFIFTHLKLAFYFFSESTPLLNVSLLLKVQGFTNY